MSFLEELITEIDRAKQPKKQSKPNKFLEFEKQLRDLAKSKGLQPRTFLEQLVKQKPEFAQNKIIQKLIGEQDVPQQKGRDAKPEVLTKRAMNVVKKSIKHSANKQRRRMDKDSVSEDEYDDFSQLINPMGQDSTSLKKIKQSPGFHDLIVTMFASGTQADLEQDEILHYISKMLNMSTVEIKAILQKDGFDFAEPDAETKFKQNMGATGGFQIGKGKSRTLNSMYEGSLDQFRNLYKKSIGSDDAAVTLRELINAINDDSLWSDQFPQLKQFTGISPLSGSRIVTAKKIPGDSADEKIAALVQAIDDDEWVNDTAKHLMRSFTLGEDEAQDRGYAQMIIQQHQDEYKKFMDTGDLMDAPTIYEKLFAYFSSSDASDQMPYGTMKARDGDPYVWLVNKLDELGLIIEEGNEFAQKVRQLKATGAKKGTKFKTSDGEEHTLEGDLNAWYAEQYARELAEKDGKVWDRMSYGDKEDYRKIANKKYGVVKSEGIEGLVEKMILMKDQVADAVADKVKDWAKSASVEQINKVLAMIKSPAKLKPEGPTSASMEEDKTDAEIDAFHTELDKLVHKYFGHSSDEKKEKVKEDAITEEEFDEAAGEKDACYHKVKSRYKVWPSAYASGALVQCRKVGASNWGNNSKK